MKYILLLTLFLTTPFYLLAQGTCSIIGYVYENNNRGFLNEVKVKITHPSVQSQEVFTDKSGKFEVNVPIIAGDYSIQTDKGAFKRKVTRISVADKKADEALFIRIEMNRKPGYMLDMALSDLLEEGEALTSYGVEGAHIEVYNNTTQKEVMNIASHPYHNVQVLLEQGNEYIFMIRKEGYYTKRMRANVNVNGCILCMEGFGNVTPGVNDNLTKENTMGSLVTNVNMKKMVLGENLKLDKIYYDLGRSSLRPEAIEGLDNLVELLKDNPNIIVELSSHTDSRGDKASNLALSQRRANSVITYIKNKMQITASRITGKGYGETRLVNSCADGVQCSEEMHQQNRRTELTVVDILKDKNQQERSLASIMQEQNFEKILDANTESYAESNTATAYTAKRSLPSPPKTIPMQYNGYKIELVYEKGEITMNHPIFLEFDEVFIDLTEDNHNSFMIGHYEDINQALRDLKPYLKQFPKGRIVAYKEGIRSVK